LDLRSKYDGPFIGHIFIKDMSNKTNTLRDIPMKMTVADFVKYAAMQLGEDAQTLRLLFGSKQLRNGQH
jgi:hypothetical protein